MLYESNYLKHYASQYYDPVKAHEYYMKNRELKGRGTRRQGTLNDQGKAAKSYVKSQIDSERDTKLNNEKESTRAQLEAAKAAKQASSAAIAEKKSNDYKSAQADRDREIEKHSQEMKTQIDQLVKQLENTKNMSPDDRERFMKRMRTQIGKLRQDNAKKRQEVEAAYKSKSASLSSNYSGESEQANTEYKNKTSSIRETSKEAKKTIRSDAKAKYESELDKIYSNSSFLKPKKTSRRKNSTK